jgi:hypothetical protein
MPAGADAAATRVRSSIRRETKSSSSKIPAVLRRGQEKARIVAGTRSTTASRVSIVVRAQPAGERCGERRVVALGTQARRP